MNTKRCLQLCILALVCICVTILLMTIADAQYFPFVQFYDIQNISTNPYSNVPYFTNTSSNPFWAANYFNSNLLFPWGSSWQGSSWNSFLTNIYQLQSQQFNPFTQNAYQAASNFYLPVNSTQPTGINTLSALSASFSPTGTISPFSSVPYSSLNPSINFYPQNQNPLYYSPQLNPWLTSASGQGYTPYQTTNQGRIVLNYYGNIPISGPISSSGYIPNTNYYTTGINTSASGTIRTTEVLEATLVLANPEYGMYCWDPPSWLNAGYKVGIWCYRIPIRAQSLDKRGRLYTEAPGFTVDVTGESGIMELFDSAISLFRAPITAAGPAEYNVTVVVDSASTIAVGKRRNATCDVCHPSPPGHISAELSWGNCHECHNLGDKLHRHAYNAFIPIDKCYTCHPSGCLSGVHGQRGIWCTPCHGTLEDAAYGRMKISGQLGKPQCGDCHDPVHSEPGTALFVDSAGHGGIWCINCHGATHVESAEPVGLNNCTLCHTIQATLKWMGPNCALCHGSSSSPHFVTN